MSDYDKESLFGSVSEHASPAARDGDSTPEWHLSPAFVEEPCLPAELASGSASSGGPIAIEERGPADGPPAHEAGAVAAVALDCLGAEFRGPVVRGSAIASILIPGCGRIAYYASGEFYAYCDDPIHTMDAEGGNSTRCIRSRVGRPGRVRHQGRPLGFLVAWLQGCALFADADDHKGFKPSFADRRAARNAFKEIPGAEPLLGSERPRRDDEADSEPDNFN